MFQYSSMTNYRNNNGNEAFSTGGYSSGTENERAVLIETHLGKVKFIADRFAAKLPSSVERDDLYSAGVIGLIEAVERFDSSRGIAFTTFAELRVRGAILDNLRSLDWASRSARRNSRDVQEAFARVEQEEGRPATTEEVAAFLKISLPELHSKMQEMNGLKISDLDARDEKTGLSAADTVADTGESQQSKIEETERRRLLAQAIDKLPERERQVVALYYLEELTMKEIGEVLGVTESRVSQMRTQAIIRLRANLPE